ncbi:MAG TPA: AbrB/MazE/SpoVT family DNA-binding domain-containing protein [Acidobacteriaceae bacterium]
MPTATLTSKGQLTIPVEVREALGLKTGDKIDFFPNQDGSYTLQPKTGSIMEMRGILAKYAKGRKALTIAEMDEAIGEAVAEDYLRSVGGDRDDNKKAS